jgi:hypothetical protein
MADVSHAVDVLRPLLAPSGADEGDDADERDAPAPVGRQPHRATTIPARELKRLHERIADLEAELERERRRSALLPHGIKQAIKGAVAEMSSLADRIGAASHRLDEAYRREMGTGANGTGNGEAAPDHREPQDHAALAKFIAKAPKLPRLDDGAPSRHGGGTPKQRIVNAIAALQRAGVREPTRIQVALLARYTPGSGTVQRVIGAVHTDGLVDYPSPARLTLTAAGVAAAGKPAAVAQADLDEATVDVLDGPSMRIVRVVKEAWPDALSRDVVAKRAGYAPGTGTVQRVIGHVHSMGVVDYPDKGSLSAAADLFVRPGAA